MNPRYIHDYGGHLLIELDDGRHQVAFSLNYSIL